MFKILRVLALLLSAAVYLSSGPVFAQDAADAAEPAKVAVTPGSTAPCPTCQKCGDAEKGTVPTVSGYCDIYARQIDYMRSAKEFRASIAARQESYEAPRRQALELYRQNLEAIYKEESRLYQEQLAQEATKAAAALDADKAESDEAAAETASTEGIPAPEMSEDGVDQTAASDDTASAEGNQVKPGVKKKVIEPSEDGETKVKKTIIVPEDAPEFDPSPL